MKTPDAVSVSEDHVIRNNLRPASLWGFRGQLDRLATANAFNPLRPQSPLDSIHTGIVHVVDAFLQGDPMAASDVSAKLLSYATALKAVACALDEINSLIEANSGNLTNVLGVGPTGNQRRRTFP
jgi:hypothetical protein